MPASTENITRWIEQSEIDYFTHFIKAWIPFNAWYNRRYNTLDSDREKINSIKKEPSDPIRKGINAYMENPAQEGQDFRNYLAALHYALEQAQLDIAECRISLNSIVREKNPKQLIENEKIGHYKYYLKRHDGKRFNEVEKVEIFIKKRNGDTFFKYEHSEYDYNHLANHIDYSRLNSQQKESLRIKFKEIEPIFIISVIESDLTESPQNYYKCDSYCFKRDLSETSCYGHIVAKALVESLYQLRNILFHGELDPIKTTQEVYKNAYFILKMLHKKIK